MAIRYHIVPKKKNKAAVLIESTKEQIQIKQVDSSFQNFNALKAKLEAWYKEKHVSFDAVPLNESNMCSYIWEHEGIHDHTMAEYYYAGGCGVGELIEEIEYLRKQQGLMPDYDDYPEGNEFDSYDFIEEEHNTDDASGFGGVYGEMNANYGGYSISASPDVIAGGTPQSAVSQSNGGDFDDFFLSDEFVSFSDDEIDLSTDNSPVVCDYVPAPSTAAAPGSGWQGGGGKGKGYRKKKDVTDPGMVIGPAITGSVVTIASQPEGGRNLVFEGMPLEVEARELKSGSAIVTGSIVDDTEGIRFNKFVDSIDVAKDIVKQIGKSQCVQVCGDVEMDERFERDFVLKLRSAKLIKKDTMRKENREDSRVELHLHTKMSDKDALVTVSDLLKTIKAWGHPAVAITDHGVIQAFPEAQKVAKDLGVKVIYGVEAYLIDNEESTKRYHIILLAKNIVGLRNLYKLVTLSHLNYFSRRPRLPREVIEQHREGLIIGSACEAGELMQAIVQGDSKERLLDIASFYDYLEIQPICNNRFLIRKGLVPDDDALIQMNKTVVELGDYLHKPVVATCDVHYLNPEDKIYREIMLTATGFPDAKEQPDLHLRTTDEMLKEFEYLGEEKAYEVVVTNSRMINDSIDTLYPVPSDKITYSPQIDGADEALSDMCYKKAKEIYGDPLPAVVKERLEYELERIIGNGYGVLYYIAHKLVKKSLDEGYLVGSRGSVGSSFVATMADITEVNPLPPHYICPNCKHSQFFEKGEYAGGFDLPRANCPECGTPMHTNGHDIPFAIFMGFNGDKVPDIDLNFSGDYQPKAHKYTEELFGRDNVFRAGTIGTIAEKTAMGYVRKYAEINGKQYRKSFIMKLAKGFTKVKNTTGQHPGGIMVCPRNIDIHHFTPVQHPANKKDSGIITTHFDYHSFEGRITKLDILGHDDPTIIRMLEDITGVDIQSIPFDDPETLSLFSSTKAIGLTPEQLMGDKVASLAVPECGTGFVRRMLEDSKPKCFSDIVRISGFSHGTNVWLNNAQTLITRGTCKLNEAISTRDDIMNFLMQRDIKPLTAFSVMENVRKGKGIEKKNSQGEVTTNYEEQMRDGGIPDWFIDSCKKISYLFPRAHAVAYVMMAFRIAWFKINYPLAFYAAYFSIRAKSFDVKIMQRDLDGQKAEFKRLKGVVDEAKKFNKNCNKEEDMMSALEVSMEMIQRGFKFMPPDLLKSDARRFKIEDGQLLPPFLAIDSLGEKVADAIVEERQKRPFTSIRDLRRRCGVSQTIIDKMKEINCITDLPEDEQISLFG